MCLLAIGLYYIHKSHNVELKVYLKLSKPTLTGHHGQHRLDILINSTFANVELLKNVKTRYLEANSFPDLFLGCQ